ncbi:MAG: spore protease YyaC [Clostridia bacterium]|nr:spore protease YyaC [Clostridia bacterium]
MDYKSYNFDMYNKYTPFGIADAIERLNKNKKALTVACVGSDLVLGDSLGPIIGTFIEERCKSNYVYGTLKNPITAKDVDYLSLYLKKIHYNSIILSIDAAVGEKSDVGTIKVINHGLKPGLGVNKNLLAIGDISIMGVVAEKSIKNNNLFNATRLGFVYKMAKVISTGLELYLNNNSNCQLNKGLAGVVYETYNLF